MIRQFLKISSTTEGERGVFTAYAIISVFGALLSFVVVNGLGGQTHILRPLGSYDFWVIFAGGVGAGIGLYAGRKWLGKPGLVGWLNALFAVPAITLLASLVAGTLALPLYGTMFGPMALTITFVEHSLLLFLWVWTVLLAHSMFVAFHKEQDEEDSIKPETAQIA